MGNLARANLSRLIKSRAYPILCLLTAAVSSALIVTMSDTNITSIVFNAFFGGLQTLTAIMAFSVAAFICPEFELHTVRLKIIAGHDRFEIYSAYFIAALAACFGIALSYFLPYTLLGYVLLGPPVLSDSQMVITTFGIIFETLVTASIMTLLSCAIGKTGAASAWAVIGIFALYILGLGVNTLLDRPEFISMIPNPRYIGGFGRFLLTAAKRLNPIMQTVLIGRSSLSIAEASAAIPEAALIFLAGYKIFKSKNIK